MGSESLEAAVKRVGSAVEVMRPPTARPHTPSLSLPIFTNAIYKGATWKKQAWFTQ